MIDPDADTKYHMQAISEPIMEVVEPFCVCGFGFEKGPVTTEELGLAGIDAMGIERFLDSKHLRQIRH